MSFRQSTSSLGHRPSLSTDVAHFADTGLKEGIAVGDASPQRFSQSGFSPVAPPSPSMPLSPASSIRGHSRFPSGSTVASSPPVRASMDSYVSKRPLTQLREHPEERDAESVNILSYDSIDQFDGFPSIMQHTRQSSREEPTIDYDWAENLPFDTLEPISVAKRRRADKSTPSMLSTKIASRFPSISRKFRSRSEKRSSSIADGLSLRDSFQSRSRASSMRSVTTRESSLDIPDRRELSNPLPTPRNSYIQEEPVEGSSGSGLGLGASEQITDEILQEEPEEEDDYDEDYDSQQQQQPFEHPGPSRTPLLPPVLAIHHDVSDTSTLQSPLQSPKVVDTPTTTPPSPFDPPAASGIPSPPLSARPSVASFHHRSIVPSSQIPPIALEGSDGPMDPWALRLGHENFCIEPEPYLPPEPTLESCRQLKADWELAERNFGRHLARTLANYSSTSQIAQLTERKWSDINKLWMLYHSQACEAATRAAEKSSAIKQHDYLLSNGPSAMSKRSSIHEPVPMAQIPSHLVGGKFPNFGDAGIVGPMEVGKPLASAMGGRGGNSSRARKRGFWKFLQDLIPGSLALGKA